MNLSLRNPSAELISGLLLMALLVGAGVLIGRNSRDEEVANAAQASGRAEQRADSAEATVAEFKAKVALERDKRLAQQALAKEALGDRDRRIEELTHVATKRHETIKREAKADEDCAALRTMPVCTAVAVRLWGGPATGAH